MRQMVQADGAEGLRGVVIGCGATLKLHHRCICNIENLDIMSSDCCFGDYKCTGDGLLNHMLLRVLLWMRETWCSQ